MLYNHPFGKKNKTTKSAVEVEDWRGSERGWGQWTKFEKEGGGGVEVIGNKGIYINKGGGGLQTLCKMPTLH